MDALSNGLKTFRIASLVTTVGLSIMSTSAFAEFKKQEKQPANNRRHTITS